MRTRSDTGSATRSVPAVALLSLLVLASPGWAQTPGIVPEADCDAPTDEPVFHPDADVRSWDGEVDPDAEVGTLDVRSHLGGIYVASSDSDTWRVEIGEVDPRGELEPSVQETGGDSFGLEVEVTHSVEVARIATGPVQPAFAQVKVWVPDLEFAELSATDRPQDANISITVGSVTNRSEPTWNAIRLTGFRGDSVALRGDAVGVRAAGLAFDDLDVETDNQPLVLDGATFRTGDLAVDNGTGCAVDLAGDDLEATTDNGRFDLRNLTVSAETAVSADNGRVHAQGLRGDTLRTSLDNGDLLVEEARMEGLVELSTDNGKTRLDGVRAPDVKITGDNHEAVTRGLAVRNLTYRSDNGNLDADLFPTSSGRWDLGSDNGEIDLHVPVGDPIGYDARVQTDNGEPRMEIPGTRVVSRSENSVHVRTRGFSERTRQVHIDVRTDNGGVTADDELSSSGAGLALPGPVPAATSVGILAAVGAAAYLLWPNLKVAGAALYSRIGRDDVLEHDTRRRIQRVVAAEPGVHFQELKRRLGTGRGILEHHLEKLVDADVLVERTASGYRCYFPHGQIDRRVMEVAPRLRAESARNLVMTLEERPGASLSELAESTGLTSATASYHLDRLGEVGIVDKGRDGNRLRVTLTGLGEQALDELALT